MNLTKPCGRLGRERAAWLEIVRELKGLERASEGLAGGHAPKEAEVLEPLQDTGLRLNGIQVTDVDIDQVRVLGVGVELDGCTARPGRYSGLCEAISGRGPRGVDAVDAECVRSVRNDDLSARFAPDEANAKLRSGLCSTEPVTLARRERLPRRLRRDRDVHDVTGQ